MLLWENLCRAMRRMRDAMSGANDNGANGAKDPKAKLEALKQRIRSGAGTAKIALTLAAAFSWTSFTFGEKDSQQSWRLGITLADKSAADAHVSILIERSGTTGPWIPGTGWVSQANGVAKGHAVSNLWIGNPSAGNAILLAQDIPFANDSVIANALTEILSALNTDPEMEKVLREAGIMYDKVLRDATKSSTITGIAFAYSDLGCPELTVMADLLGQGVNEGDATFTVKRDRANLAWGDGKGLYGLKYGEYAANASRTGGNQMRPHKINGSVSGSGEQALQDLINLAAKDAKCPKSMKVISNKEIGGRSRGADLKASLWGVGSTEAAITAQDKAQAAAQGAEKKADEVEISI